MSVARLGFKGDVSHLLIILGQDGLFMGRSRILGKAGLAALVGVGFWLGFLVLDGGTYLLLVLVLMFHFDLVHAIEILQPIWV